MAFYHLFPFVPNCILIQSMANPLYFLDFHLPGWEAMAASTREGMEKKRTGGHLLPIFSTSSNLTYL